MAFWNKKESADDRILKIIELLYPPLDLRITPEGKKYHVDYSIDSNLDAVLMDLQDGINDSNIHRTLRMCVDKLNEVRRILDAYAQLDPESEYLVVDDGSDEIIDIPEKIH